MTYTFKLSRRLALAHLSAMLAPLAFILACTTSDLTDSSSSSSDTPPFLTDLFVSPRSVVLEPNQPLDLRALRGVLSDDVTEWSATGGTITADGVFYATESGTYKVAGKGKGKGKRDTTIVVVTPTDPTLADLAVSPDPTSLSVTQSHVFIARGVLSDGSVVETAVTWQANGGSIDAGGLYTAGSTPGDYRVIARSVSADVADTALVTIATSVSPEPAPEPAPPTVTAIFLRPASVTLESGATQQFAATAMLSDSTTQPVTVTYRATGGSITSGGLYAAGSTAGSFAVIATDSSGTRSDTAAVTIPAPPPAPPATGTTYFLADAERGDYSPWTGGPLSWQVVQYMGTVAPSSTRARFGTKSWKFEVTNHSGQTVDHDVRLMSSTPQTRMDPTKTGYVTGYYSWWMFIDAGYAGAADNGTWNLLLGWMTGVSGQPAPIAHIGLENRGGVLQIMARLTNAYSGCYTAPAVPGYQNFGGNGYYYQTAQSPAGIAAFPKGQWVHLSVYYKMAASGGQITVWQDGVKVMDLAGAGVNTLAGGKPPYGYEDTACANPSGAALIQFGNYGGRETGILRHYVDDFRVTDYRPVP